MKSRREYSWIHPLAEVKKTARYGRGVFAKGRIKKGTILAIFGGYVMTRKQEDHLPPSIRDVAHQIADGFVIGINRPTDMQRVDHFNHRCDPNAGFKGQIFLVAMRDIRAGEEITFDYAMVLHRAKGLKPYVLQCLCGSRRCRKVIDEYGWKNPTLQRKYRGYFQWYLQEKIKDLGRRTKLANRRKHP